jgi:hypothetical protein
MVTFLKRVLKRVIKKKASYMNISVENSTQEEHLAYTPALAFDDTDHNDWYLNCCKTYLWDIVQKAFKQAQEFPQEQIRKSRPTLFFYLVKKLYAHT